MIDAEKLSGIDRVEYLASVPKGEIVVSMVFHKGSLYVAAEKHIYVLKDDKRLEKIS